MAALEQQGKRPGIGVGVIVTRGDRLLMVRRTTHGDGRWDVPGGFLNYCETFEECAVREVREETGIELGGAEFLAVTNDIHPDGTHNVTIVFADRDPRGEATVRAPEELDRVGWFPWSDLPGPRYLPLERLLSGRSYPPVRLPPE